MFRRLDNREREDLDQPVCLLVGRTVCICNPKEVVVLIPI